jgi:Tol biopolymer transport system component
MMTLAAGTHLGSYEVLAPLGAGGMGEVYQAHDTKLGRDVAIKVLPEAFAHDLERLSRFQREAKMLAALNHPNIATIYGLEQTNGTSYLVMELVSGETLAERVKREGALPVEETLTICKQIAEALEAAHERGIIHRDLKPANVKLTPEGKVKVLDFGLAKAFAGDGATENPSNSPTLSIAATIHGVILGTAAYMSPEQAKGKAVDKRTDIWAFGCVLYELLTGKQAFHGEDVTDILAAVVRAEPDWQALPAATPVKIRDLLRRCLQKDKTQRLRDAGDARIEIQEAIAVPSLGTTATVPAKRGWRQAVVLALAVLVAVAIAGLAGWNLKPTPPRPVTRTVIALPPGDRLSENYNNTILALSPDGSYLVYAATHNSVQQLYLRALDSLEARVISGTEGATNPFFSPDGEWIGFFAGEKLKKIAVSGGAAVTLGGTGNNRGASWGRQGTIIFAPNAYSVMQQVSDAGGTGQPVTRFDKGENTHRWPEFLPDGRSLLFAGGPGTGGWQTAQVVVQSPKGERRNLVDGGTDPRYALSGHLLYAQAGILMAMPFDLQRLQTAGKAVPVLENVLQYGSGAAQYSISSTGSLAYIPGGAQAALDRLVWVSRNGTEQPLAAPSQAYGNLQLSSDGRRLAIQQGTDLWLYDFGRAAFSRFTFEATNTLPVWTPDGRRVAYQSTKEGPQNIFWQRADGSGQPERLTTSEHAHAPRSFSPDGQLLAFSDVAPATGFDIWVLRMSDHKAQLFLQTMFNEAAPSFSPDGRWLAYISDASGRYEIYVQPYPGPGGKYEISTEGGTEPVWNPNGKELFYRSGDKMMAVDITTQPSFAAGKPKMLFEGSYVATTLTQPLYSVSPDGQRFLMRKYEQSSSTLTQVVVVQNWFEELKQKVPSGKK